MTNQAVRRSSSGAAGPIRVSTRAAPATAIANTNALPHRLHVGPGPAALEAGASVVSAVAPATNTQT